MFDDYRFNTILKVYPDGNFQQVTASRNWFLNEEGKQVRKEWKQAVLNQYYQAVIDYDPFCQRDVYELNDVMFYGLPDSPCIIKKRGKPPVRADTPIGDMLLKAYNQGLRVSDEYFTYQKTVNENSRSKDNSIHRAISKIYDICYCNEFQYFATFTFNPQKVDSFDCKEVMKKVKRWFNSHQTRNNLSYIAIPEFHQSGRIHLHCLYSGDLKLVSSGKYTKKHQEIFNITSWSYGFSTAIPLVGDRGKIAYYMTKYITKDLDKIFGKYYYSSSDLKREPDKIYTMEDYTQINTKECNGATFGVNFRYDSSMKYNSEHENTLAILRELGVLEEVKTLD